MRIDFDSAWKDTTEVYFAALLELFEPQSLPRACDREPVSFLDQEMQELAQVLGDESGAEVDVGGDGTVAAGSESQPYHGSRRGRRRARRSSRLRVDKLVRVPLPMGGAGGRVRVRGWVRIPMRRWRWRRIRRYRKRGAHRRQRR